MCVFNIMAGFVETHTLSIYMSLGIFYPLILQPRPFEKSVKFDILYVTIFTDKTLDRTSKTK